MGLLNRKPKLSIEECCRQFYDSNIFHAIIAGTDVWSGLLDTYFESVAEADQSFLSIDPTLFRNEMTALRIEMFSLAWSRKVKHEDFAILQSIFTKCYLEENGRLDIWDIMGEYNGIVAYSASANEMGMQMGGTRAEKINKLRANFLNSWWREANIVNRDALTQEEKDKLMCVVRVANRIGADIWREDKGVNVTLGLLSGMLASRLGYDVNPKPEALIRLGSVILGFHNGAEEYLESVDLQAKELS